MCINKENKCKQGVEINKRLSQQNDSSRILYSPKAVENILKLYTAKNFNNLILPEGRR